MPLGDRSTLQPWEGSASLRLERLREESVNSNRKQTLRGIEGAHYDRISCPNPRQYIDDGALDGPDQLMDGRQPGN